MVKSVLKKGDLIWVNFNPSLGHEQKGKRPALVVSEMLFNQASGFVWVIPITSQCKGRNDEVYLPKDLPIEGVILFSQIKTLDLSALHYEYICSIGDDFMDQEITGRLGAVLGI